jgi:hypothetical protein
MMDAVAGLVGRLPNSLPILTSQFPAAAEAGMALVTAAGQERWHLMGLGAGGLLGPPGTKAEGLPYIADYLRICFLPQSDINASSSTWVARGSGLFIGISGAGANQASTISFLLIFVKNICKY